MGDRGPGLLYVESLYDRKQSGAVFQYKLSDELDHLKFISYLRIGFFKRDDFIFANQSAVNEGSIGGQTFHGISEVAMETAA